MPKSLVEIYSELLNKLESYETEEKYGRFPDPAVNPKEYVAKQAEVRDLQNHVSFLDHAVGKLNLSNETLSKSLTLLYGEEDFDKIKKKSRSDLRYKISIQKNLFRFYPELKAKVSNDDLDMLAKSSSHSDVVVNKLMESGDLRPENLDFMMNHYLFTRALSDKTAKKISYLTCLDQSMNEEEKNTIGAIDTYESLTGVPFEQQITHPYSERIAHLKENIPEDISSDPALLKEYQDALEYADKHLTLVRDDIKEERNNYESDVERVEARYPKKIHDDNLATYNNGQLDGLYNTAEVGLKKTQTVKPEKTDDFTALLNGSITFSDDTKNGLRSMLKKMEELQLEKYAFDKSGEDGDKIYGHCKFYRDKYALEQALKSGNAKNIIAAKKQYEKSWNDMQELYNIAKQSFSQNDSLFPGNVDGTRNSDLSWEFTSDVMTTAQVNTVFLIYMNLKNTGKSIDEYVENPVKDFYSDIEKKVEPFSFEGQSKGKAFDEVLDMFLGLDDYKDVNTRIRSSNVVPVMGVGRVASSPAMLEKDPEKNKDDFIFSTAFTGVWDNVLELNNTKFGYLKNLSYKPEGHARKIDTLANLLVASEADRNPNAMFAGFPTTDLFGRVKGESFNWNTYVENKPADYAGILTRYSTMLNKAVNSKSDGMKVEDCLEAMNNVSKKLLLQKRAEKNTPEYKALEDVFLSLNYSIPQNASPELITKLEIGRDEYLHAIRLASPMDYLTGVNERISESKRDVHGGSDEFTEAEKALLALEKEYRLLQSFGEYTHEDRVAKQLETVKKSLADATQKINKYLNYKNEQKRKGKRMNAKSKKRINSMKLALDSLEELRFAADDKVLEIENTAARNERDSIMAAANVTPEKTKEELIAELRNNHLNDPDFDEFIQNLDILNSEMDGYMKPDQGSWKEITRENLDQLIEQYHRTGSNLEWLISKHKASNEEQIVSFRKTCMALSAIMSKDMEVLSRYNPEKGLKTLPTLLENARTDILDLSNDTISTKGGVQSERFPMTIIDSDGKPVTGYFTKASYHNPAKEINAKNAEISKTAKTPEGAEMIKNFFTNFRQYKKNNGYTVDNSAFVAEVFIYDMLKVNDEPYYLSKTKLVSTLARVYGKTEKEIQNLCGSKALDTMTRSFSHIYTAAHINNVNGFPEGSRIDSRNVSMSVVADLIGMPDIICRSRSMKLRAKDGTIVDGTFMEEAKGIDVQYPGKVGFKPSIRAFSGGTGTGLQQLADLQVLDYICGNTDRHAGNIFYQFENGKLVGVQGIDNDTSFNTKTEHIQGFSKMPGPNDMLVISRKTADKIMELKPGQLIFALRGRLDEKAIEFSVKRLKALKDTIRKSREHYAANEKKIKTGYIRELEDQEWKNVNFTELTGEDRTNIFTNAAKAPGLISSFSGRKNSKNAVAVGNTNRATEGGLLNELKLINKEMDCLKEAGIKADDINAAIRDYLSLVNRTLRNVNSARKLVQSGKTGSNTPEAIFGQYVSKSDMESIRESANRIYQVTDRYIHGADNALNGREPSKREKVKMDALAHVRSFADRSRVITVEEQEKTTANTRQATEQMAKAMKQPAPAAPAPARQARNNNNNGPKPHGH